MNRPKILALFAIAMLFAAPALAVAQDQGEVRVESLEAASGSTAGTLLGWGVAATSNAQSLVVPLEPAWIPATFDGRVHIEIRSSHPEYMPLPGGAPLALIDGGASRLTLIVSEAQ